VSYARPARIVTVIFIPNPNQVSYAALAELLFDRIGDPTMLNRVGSAAGRSNHGLRGSLMRSAQGPA
jgi:hypothetical protein